MGSPSSGSSGGINGVISTIASAASDVQGTIASINQVASVFAALTPLGSSTRRFQHFAGEPATINSALKVALAAVLGGTSAAFAKRFPADTPAGADNGLIPDLNASGPLDSVVIQMAQNLSNWSINVTEGQVLSMADTIQEEFNARGGVSGTSFGSYPLNTSETIDWAVGYGPFAITGDQNGLIYGFTAALNYQM